MRHTNPSLSIGLTFLNNKNLGWSVYGGDVMEKIKTNGEGFIHFKVTLSFLAEFDTTFVKLHGEPMPLMSIFGCIMTHC